MEPNLDAPTLEALTTVAGASLLTSVLMQFVILRIADLTAQARDRYGPFLAILTGVIVVLIATFTIVEPSRQDVVQGAVTGIFAGLAAIGMHSVGKRVTP